MNESFRAGACYKTVGGEVLRLREREYDDTCLSRYTTGPNIHSPGGRYVIETGQHRWDPQAITDLLPGEVNAQGEPIAPTFYCAAETISKVHDSDCALHNAPALPPGPCDCSLAKPEKTATTYSDLLRKAMEKLEAGYAAQTTHRQEANMPEGWARIGYDLGTDSFTLWTNKPVAEPKRPRLTWADSKAFDNFADYEVCSDTATPDHAYSHPLTRVADAGAQVSAEFGSAHILPKA